VLWKDPWYSHYLAPSLPTGGAQSGGFGILLMMP